MPGRFVVDVVEGIDPHQVAHEIAAAHGGRVAYVYDQVIGGFAFQGPDAAGEQMVMDPRVRAVYADYEIRIADVRPELDAIRTTQAWARGFIGTNARIAFVDTGVNPSNPNLSSRVLDTDGSCVDDDGIDLNGHGTRMFGIAYANNDIGVLQEGAGYAIKVFPGSSSSTSTSALVCGLNIAKTLNVQVVNLSLTGVVDAAQKAAVEDLHNSGKAVVAAAGNTGGDVSPPASVPRAVAVSALDNTNTSLAPFSNRGATVDIGAPGQNITQLTLSGCCSTGSGTSHATAHVSAVMAEVMATTKFPPAVALFVVQQQGFCPGSDAGDRGPAVNISNGDGGPCNGPQRPGDTDGITEPALNFEAAVNAIVLRASAVWPTIGQVLSGRRTFKLTATSALTSPDSLIVDFSLGTNAFRRAGYRPDVPCPVPASCHVLIYDTLGFPDGRATFTARVTKPDGSTAMTSIPVIIDNAASPVVLTPTNGQVITGRQIFKVIASDVRIPPRDLIVDFKLGTDAFRRAGYSPDVPCPTPSSCYTLTYDTSGFPNGATTFTARVRRADGTTATASIQVIVNYAA